MACGARKEDFHFIFRLTTTGLLMEAATMGERSLANFGSRLPLDPIHG
jgi:hypothetical protein